MATAHAPNALLLKDVGLGLSLKNQGSLVAVWKSVAELFIGSQSMIEEKPLIVLQHKIYIFCRGLRRLMFSAAQKKGTELAFKVLRSAPTALVD